MRVDGVAWRSIAADGPHAVRVIDQTRLPFAFATLRLESIGEVARAIRSMQVRGAPLIGVAAAYGVALAMQRDAGDTALADAHAALLATRPTAVNLRWALARMRSAMQPLPPAARAEAAWHEAGCVAEEDVAINRALGRHGAGPIAAAYARTRRPVHVLTHCNAGWIATVDYGTALSAVYQAHDAGVPVHVWVDETRPRNQGLLTAWELAAHGVPHTLIADNAGGHLMQRGEVDLVIVGADRVSRGGDVCNKIGTYLKALAAFDNGVPFYAAVPSPTIDWELADALREIPIEERAADEVRLVSGRDGSGRPAQVALADDATAVANPAFDVTPARLVTGIVTERGIAAPAELARLFAPARAAA
ncbi:MAG: S-methyl-5-thioribose-1-phosphate isomerase [Burkholderiales bacterium]|jgi:methylthioribose-1-phosphate isomerase|nr:S-methyl-5-thioribose-1-phosphate isomerase [Burkholderiales bacterium]